MSDLTLFKSDVEAAPGPAPSPARRGPAGPPAAVFVIFCYQQEHCIAECLESALAQDYPNLRIIVSDDASADRTGEVVQDMLAGYRGPHQTAFIRQPRNLRVHHLNALIPEFMTAPFCIMGHGDDVFHPERVSGQVRAMLRDGTHGATANAIVMDAEGRGSQPMIDPDADHDLSLETLCRESTNRACFGAGLAWRRGVFGQFGRMRPGPRQVDQILVFRATLLGGVSLIRAPLMRYRLHEANLNMTRMAELASESQKRLIEERRRNNLVATIVAQRLLLRIARQKKLGDWDYEALDRILMEALYAKASRWALFRSRMADDGIGIY